MPKSTDRTGTGKKTKPKKKDGSKYLGGMSGKAAKSLKSMYKKRKSRLDKI